MNEVAYTKIPTELAVHIIGFAFICGVSLGGILALAVVEFFERRKK